MNAPQRLAVAKCLLSYFYDSFLKHHLFQTAFALKRFRRKRSNGAGDDHAGDVPWHRLAGLVDELLPLSLGHAAD